MEYEYGGWFINAIPDFSLGKFFAHARLTPSSPESNVDTEMHIERNLAWFDNEDEAIEVARQWAIEWIDARNDNLASTEADPSMWQDDMPAKAPAGRKSGYMILMPGQSYFSCGIWR
jgi:hypothetical protein